MAYEESALIDDLGISSMDILTLLAYLEEEFDITISEKYVSKLVTAGDIVDIVVSLQKNTV